MLSVKEFCERGSKLDTECVVDLINTLMNGILLISIIFTFVVLCYVLKVAVKNKFRVKFQEHTSRWILTLCLVCVHMFEIGEGVLCLRSNTEILLTLHLLICAVSSVVAMVFSIVFYDKLERLGRSKLLVIFLVYWPCVLSLKITKLITIYNKGLSLRHLRMQVTWAAVLMYTLLVGVEVSVLGFQKYPCKKRETFKEPYSDLTGITYRHPFSTLLSKSTFSWIVPLLRSGYQSPLELSDLGTLPEDQLTDYQFIRFNKSFAKEKQKATKEGRPVALWGCYLKTFWKTLISGGIIKILGDLTGLVGPLSISIVLSYVEREQEGKPEAQNSEKVDYPTAGDLLRNGYVVSVIVLIATFLQSTFSNNFSHMAIMEGVHVRSALQSLVYRKALRMSNVSGLDMGAVVNHMSVDAFNIMLLFSMGHYIWAVPFKIILLLILLYNQLGYSSLIGAACIYILSPLQYFVCSKLSGIQKIALEVADRRLKHTSELLQGIKLLKLHGWEKCFSTYIKKIRAEELSLLRKDAVYVAVNTFITQGSSILLTLVTFFLYSKIEGKPLTSSEVFTGLALFNQLTVPLYIIPFVIPIVINAVVSTKRLSKFLSEPEVDSGVPWRREVDGPPATMEFNSESGSVVLHLRDSELYEKGIPFFDDVEGIAYSPVEVSSAVTMNHAWFSWDTDSSTKIPILQDINIQVPAGKLTMVVGPVGSGKTTLLSGMLGELSPYKGSVQWANIPYVSYVSQKPWLLNATLKENILFGQVYDGRRYHQVIHACALQPDIDLLPARDMTEIGERGLNLSGGQKQRIALARAFYAQTKTVILDDPLSALDAHVSNHIFEHGIKTLLVRRHKTVVLVTHRLDLLVHAYKVIVIENGKLRCQGSLTEIENNDPDISSLWKKTNRSDVKEGTVKERHRLIRMVTKQALYRSPSVQEIRPRSRLVSLNRQMSHDPSSPLPVHDWNNEDTPLTPGVVASPRCFDRISSTESLRSRVSSSSAGAVLRHSWQRTPSRLNSRISSQTADGCIEEEDEEEEDTVEMLKLKANEPSLTASLNSVLSSAPASPTSEVEWKLIQEEDKQHGQIPFQVYCTYMKSCCLLAVVIVIFLFICNQGIKLGTDFWLSDWTESAKRFNTTEAYEEDEEMRHYVIVYTVLSLGSIILSFVTNLSAQLVTLRAVKVLHDNMLEKVVQYPMRFFDTNPVGRIINRFSADMNIIDRKLPVTVPVLLRFILLCLSAIIVDVLVTPFFIVAVIPIIGVYYFLQYFFRFSSRELQRLDSITKSPIFSHFSETLAGVPTIRAFREEKRFIEKMNDFIDTNNIAFIMMNCANCWLGISLDYLGGAILFIASVTAISAAIAGQISPSFVGIAMTYTLLVPIYLNWVVRNLANVEMYMSSVERVQNYSSLPVEEGSSRKNKSVPPDWPQKGEIKMENLTMKYETSVDPVLKNISLTFKPGEKVGICGRTGSGKSSLVMGLFRIVPITEGHIYIDDIDIAKVPLETLRSRISIIPQEPVLFTGSIRQNLDPRHQHSDDELWSALESAHLREVVLVCGGLDSDVGEEGSKFSTGQNQLFCLARAMLHPSKILVLDEATSSLDADLDSVLQETIMTKWAKHTILAIAHRVTTIEKFDRVVVLDGGKVAEVGTPKELKARGSIFASLLKSLQQ